MSFPQKVKSALWSIVDAMAGSTASLLTEGLPAVTCLHTQLKTAFILSSGKRISMRNGFSPFPAFLTGSTSGQISFCPGQRPGKRCCIPICTAAYVKKFLLILSHRTARNISCGCGLSAFRSPKGFSRTSLQTFRMKTSP